MTKVLAHNSEAKTFLDRLKSDRFPHAWLFSGPRGLGKASLAKLLAGVVLGDQWTVSGDEISLTTDRAYKMVSAGNHPDVRIVDKEGGKAETANRQISVAEIRAVTGFFELQASLGGYRVCIVDALDDLNANGANELLKTLEEPPANSLLILIYHGSTALLPTIRSRCVELQFDRLDDQTIQKIAGLNGHTETISERVLKLCNGSPGRFISLQQSDPENILSSLEKGLFSDWPEVSGHRLTKLESDWASSEGAFDIGATACLNWLALRAKHSDNANIAAALSRGWQELSQTVSRGRNLKLDLSERSGACINLMMQLSQEERQGR